MWPVRPHDGCCTWGRDEQLNNRLQLVTCVFQKLTEGLVVINIKSRRRRMPVSFESSSTIETTLCFINVYLSC